MKAVKRMAPLSPYLYKKYHLKHEEPQQPDKCKGCVWGRWTGTKQVCGRVICQRLKR